MPLEGHVHHFGEGGAGDVVLGRSETAADDQCVTPRERGAKGENDPIVIVPHVLVKV